MARGITENDVHTAADAVLASGERPTVERIRAYLGTGSPNTVVRWLDSWWTTLSARLQAKQARLALPDAPGEVAEAASGLWELALQRAGAHAEARIVEERVALAQARDELMQREVVTQAQMQNVADEAAHARESLQVAEMRLTDLQRLLEQQAAQLQDLQRERGADQVRLTGLTAELAQVRAQADAAVVAAASERDTLLQQLRGSEDRAAAEIDRARQHAQRLQAEAKAQARQHQSELAAARQHSDALARDLQAVRREGDGQRARADALEQQLARLADLPAQLEATLNQTRPKAPANRAAPRKRTKRGGNV